MVAVTATGAEYADATAGYEAYFCFYTAASIGIPGVSKVTAVAMQIGGLEMLFLLGTSGPTEEEFVAAHSVAHKVNALAAA